MAKLAIKGHPTRGEEVIEILEMFGGVNLLLQGGWGKGIYLIDPRDSIIYYIQPKDIIGDLIIFTIEEFIEKFPYKVGDKVLYKIYGIYSKIKSMLWNKEKEQVFYRLESNKLFVATADELNPCEEETMSKNICDSCPNNEGCWVDCDRKKQEMEKKQKTYVIKNDCNTQTVETNINMCDHKVIPFNDCPHDEVELDLANKYEIVVRDGKTFIVRKRHQYPKTYEECCKVVNASPYVALVYDKFNGQTYSYDIDNLQIYENIRELRICRDAYWKIAGDWKPDVMYCDLYCIGYDGNVITWKMQGGCRLLAFPTEEMRDAFYENFKYLIEACKELL